MPKPIPLPKIDLEPFQKAVNEAAARASGLWFGYIALLAYTFITVGAVTQRDLLLERPVKLPVLNVDLPLVGFFTVAPIFFLINHFYLLLQLVGLGRRIREFNDAIKETGCSEGAERAERRKLDTFLIVQMLGGTEEERKKLTGWFLKAVALITVVIAPVALLLFIQLRFLPYQDEWITWWLRIVLFSDLLLLLRFWTSIKRGDWARWPGWLQWRNWKQWNGVSLRALLVKLVPWRALLALFVLLFACVIATFPGELADGGMNAEDWREPKQSYLSSVKGRLFGDLKRTGAQFGPGRTQGWFFLARAIDLPDDRTLIDLDKLDKIANRNKDNKDQLNPWQMDRTFSLRGRNLRGASFDRSDLRNVDFFGAQLQGASLYGADLQGASLEGAGLEGASLVTARLQGASLEGAGLEGALLDYARLQGAFLDSANLQGASLARARLQGASLGNASLQGASLKYAHLQGASLDLAGLQGASLDSANLQGASLAEARLQGASLKATRLQGASLSDAHLQGASLDEVRLQDASLDGAFLWRAYGTPDIKSLSGVWVKEPGLKAMTVEQIAELEEEALLGVNNDAVKQRIRTALARLSAPEKDLKDSSPQMYWSELVKKTSEEDHRRGLAVRLTALACDGEDAPYVAQSLVAKRAGLERVGLGLLPRVAKILLDAAEGKTDSCSGAKGLNTAAIVELRKWVVKAHADETIQKTK